MQKQNTIVFLNCLNCRKFAKEKTEEASDAKEIQYILEEKKALQEVLEAGEATTSHDNEASEKLSYFNKVPASSEVSYTPF